jgi:hypothetical protein
MALNFTLQQILDFGGNVRLAIRKIYKELEDLDTRVGEVEGGEATLYIQQRVPSSVAKTDITPLVFRAPVAGSITEVKFIPDDAVTADDTDYLTVKVLSGTTDIVTAKTTKTTGGTAMAANTDYAFTVVTAGSANVLAAGAKVEFSSVNSGSTGKVFPGGLVYLKFVPS